MEGPLLHHSVFLSPPPPPPRHLAELRIEAAPSVVAFSAPCAAAGRKRRCLLPPSSPRKRMLLELHPFGSAPRPLPAPSPPRWSSSVAASDFSFPSATPWTGGSGSGGSIFAFAENAVATPTPSPTGSTASCGVVALVPSPKQPPLATTIVGGRSSSLPSAGPTASGGFLFMAQPEESLTPKGSNATGGGVAFLSPEPSLSPRKDKDIGTIASSPTPAPSASPPFVFSAPRTSAPPVRKKRPRPHHATAGAQKVAKTAALAAGEVSRSSILSGSSARPCCTFFASPARAPKQEAKKASTDASHLSPAGSRCAFDTSPVRPSSVDKTNKREREVEVSSVARECPTSPAACSGAVVAVRVTCTCGVQKDFSFEHCD